jgi:hypothetical protein
MDDRFNNVCLSARHKGLDMVVNPGNPNYSARGVGGSQSEARQDIFSMRSYLETK